MPQIKKIKIFPKIKKKLKWFITEESGKISKKDALWLAVWAILLSWATEVLAWHTSVACDPITAPHNNWFTSSVPTSAYQAWWHVSHISNVGINSWPSANWTHVSGNIGLWHWNEASVTVAWHSSHGSHGSHGSHWSRR
jgi:hypothetical protein